MKLGCQPIWGPHQFCVAIWSGNSNFFFLFFFFFLLVSSCFRSYLDMYKVIIFSYLFWFVLTIIFITGTTRISIFCMGYLVACFYFLLFGGDLLLKPIRSILRYWDWLIAYNVFVITMKNILSVSGCFFSSVLNAFAV